MQSGSKITVSLCNDKHRLKVGEPGYPVASAERGRVMVSKCTSQSSQNYPQCEACKDLPKVHKYGK